MSIPGVQGARYRLEFGRHALEVDAGDGGRIVAYALEGENVLATRDDAHAAYGSSFWPSPQSDWDWPPPPELDRLPWTELASETGLALRSGVNAALGLSATVRVAADAASGVVRLSFGLENHGSEPRRVARWQNSRVRPRGLTFYASGPTLPQSTLEPVLANGIAWLEHDPDTMTENAKSFADGREGWLAHLAGELLFVKAWSDVPPGLQAPGEAEVELYVDRSGTFVEVEQQGPYAELLPGASSAWDVAWLLERVPPDVDRRLGSAALVETARRLAERARRVAEALR